MSAKDFERQEVPGLTALSVTAVGTGHVHVGVASYTQAPAMVVPAAHHGPAI